MIADARWDTGRAAILARLRGLRAGDLTVAIGVRHARWLESAEIVRFVG